MARYQFEPFDYVTPPELSGAASASAPVIIVGAGPIGLAAAIDLATHGVASIVVDDNNVVSVGSRAICWAKRSLEIFDRLGVGERMLEKASPGNLAGSIAATARSIISIFFPRTGTNSRPSSISSNITLNNFWSSVAPISLI